MTTVASKVENSTAQTLFENDRGESDKSGQKRKRLRAVLVCGYCRRRKVKCDRQLPCSNCVRMNIADTCSYKPHVDSKNGEEYIMELQLPLDKENLGKTPQDTSPGISGQFPVDPKRFKGSKPQYQPSHHGYYEEQRPNLKSETQYSNSTANGVPADYRGAYMPPPTTTAADQVASEYWGNTPRLGYTGVNGNGKARMGVYGTPQVSGGLISESINYPASSSAGGMGPSPNYMGGVSSNGQRSFSSVTASESARVSSSDALVNPVAPKEESDSFDSQKTEIEMLKQRLQQIEKSLVGASLLAKPIPPPPVPLQPILRAHPTSYSLGQRQEFGGAASSPNIGVPFSTGLTPLPHVGSGTEDTVNAMLPPLNPNYKYSTGSQSPPLHPALAPYTGSFPQTTKSSLVDRLSLSSSGPSTNDSLYQVSPATTDTSVRSESGKSMSSLAEELMIGRNIYGSPTDTINFYEFYSSVNYKDAFRRNNFGPFAWTSLMKRDPGLRALWDHFSSLKDSSKDDSAALCFPLNDSTNELTVERANALLDTDSSQDEKRFHKRALEADGYEEIVPYDCIIEMKKKQMLNESTLPLGLTFYDGRIGRQLQLIDKIKVVLPKKRVIWKLIHRFFTWVYPYCPFLDEEYFRRDVARIIGPESYDDEPLSKIEIEKKLDLATMGILLIVLRYSYLTLFSNNTELNEQTLRSEDPDPKIQAMKYLMLNPININSIDVAELCLEQFKLLRKTSFTVLQLALYIRLYHTYAPEDGDGADGGDSQVLSSVLIQMAYSLGLNREPDENSPDLRINNLSRKIWQYLIVSDLHLGITFGNPLSTDTIYYDTKIPFYVPGGENLIDKVRDRQISQRFGLFSTWHDDIRNILKMTLGIKTRTSVPDLCNRLSTYELHWYQTSGTLSDALKCENSSEQAIIDRNFITKIYLGMKSFLLTLYFHLYLHYERTDPNVSYFYFKKCLLISITDIMPHYETLLCKSEVISDMIINPTLELVVHRASLIFLSAIVRVNSLVYHMRMKPDHAQSCANDKQYLKYFQKLCQLSSCLTRASEYSISAIGKISNRYYYAWRILKGHTFMLKTVTSPNFFESMYLKSPHFQYMKFTGPQVDELIILCEATLSKFRDSAFCTFGFSNDANSQLLKCNQSNSAPILSSNSADGSVNPTERAMNSEVDKVWLQVLCMKYDQLLNDKYPEAVGLGMGPAVASQQSSGLGASVNTPGVGASDFDRFGYDMEMSNRYDCFSDLPFEKFFSF